MDNHHLITAHDVRRRYGGGRGFEAVRGVSLSVRKGELFALLGTNGAGKTSLLELLEGLAPPTSGTVRVLGQDPYRSRRQVRARIGIMLQEGGFPADLTVTETARMWAGTLTRPRPVAEALELVDLKHRSQVPVKQLSGGERRRLDLAVTLLGQPEVLFLDEPTTGLDPRSRRQVWHLVRNLLQSGTTIVLTTHYLQEVEELADRLAIMHGGAIVRTGTPAEVAATQPARITFRLPAAARPLPVLPGVADNPVRVAGDMVLYSQDLQATLAALLAWAAANGIDLTDLDARPGSLEEAFLAAAGPPSAVPHNDNDQEVAA
jgi:ABC-2 type transport system ATP-binding protein